MMCAGWQLGSEPQIQVPNLVTNHLTTGLLNYIKTTGRFTSGINLFEKLRSRDPEISSLLAQVYIASDDEVKAVRLLHEAVQELPMDYSLLDTQADFCKLKGRSDLALEIAKRSVVSAPSEFTTWARLVEIYVGLEQWDLALLTLNSCPMFTYQDKDAPPMAQPDRLHLPILPETMCEEIDDTTSTAELDLVHPTLRKLVAANFKGTFQRAYALLTEITKKVGWDQLLRIRSQVFVMEEEYRHERHGGASKAATPQMNGAASHGASPAPSPTQSELDGTDPAGNPPLSDASSAASTTAINGTEGASPSLSKPTSTITPEAVHAGSDNPEAAEAATSSAAAATPDPAHTTYTSFKHKRLCERWLDNLFMVLYEDLRVFTIWRTELGQHRVQQAPYKKTAEEWEVLASLAQRLHHDREAVEAWQQCLSLRFSPKAMAGVMAAWDRDGRTRDVVGAVIRLVCWQYRWYSEVSRALFHFPPSLSQPAPPSRPFPTSAASPLTQRARVRRPVLPDALPHRAPPHRGRGRRQDPQHDPGHAAAPARPRPH